SRPSAAATVHTPLITPPAMPATRRPHRARETAAGPSSSTRPRPTTPPPQPHANGSPSSPSSTSSPSLDRIPSRTELPWPEPFERLEEVFRALNTVYAFCSARKHLATTFDTMRSSVETLIKRELEVHHIAQLKSLLPDLINFAYVETDMLEVHLDGGNNMSEGRRKAMAKRADTDWAFEEAARLIGLDEGREAWNGAIASTTQASEPPPLEMNSAGTTSEGLSGPAIQEAGELLPSVASLQQSSKAAASGKRRRDDYVLLFEFNDGTLQGPKATARGRPGMRRGPQKKPSAIKRGPTHNPPLNSLPSASSMKRLIDKRNLKFETAVCELLAACQAKGEDAVDLLISAANDHVPINPQTAERPMLGETPQKKKIRLEYLMNNPDQRPEISEVIEEMKAAPWWVDQVVPGGRKTFPDRQPKYDGLTFALSQELVNALWSTRKIEEFYTHQAEALNALDEGLNVIVSTSTSSGKSLIYQVPIIRALEEDRTATALFIFPTKALAQDQKRSLQDLICEHETLDETEVKVATYDGDTDRSLRVDIRENANIIFTNPDMLHQSILPNEHNWRRFLRSLRFVVVDELHTYNGLFGAHVSLIMRRLRRICTALGNRRIQFISCSATVANPKEHMQTLFGIQDVEVITEDGSPHGKKEWLIWNPPLMDEKDPKQGRVSAYAEVSKIFRHLVERGVRTIIFTKVRRTCEIVIAQIRKDLLIEHRHDIVDKVMSYRSGYSPEDRRQIEQDMWKGSLLGIVATSALELGIDIGSLDAVIMLGFPYSISSLRQQSGRAGRRLKDSLTVLCCDPFPMDQHYARFPEDVFNQPDAALSVDLNNDFVLEAHLQCAAEEMPIHPVDDLPFFGDHLQELCRTRLVADDDGFFHCRNELRPNPSKEVAIRGARQVTYCYIDVTPGRRDGPRIMEEVEIDRAIFEAFEGAVFMHQGSSYICKEISHDTRIAKMIQADVNFHTRPRDHTDTDAMETHRIRALRNTTSKAYFGKVTITTHVWGYFKVDKRANILDAVDVDCPPFVRHTKGFWLDVPNWLIALLAEKQINVAAAIHAAEHALLSLTPMFVVSLAGDVRTECKIAEREYQKSKATTRKRPARLIFYDMPGQNGGVCEKAFSHLDGLIRIAVAVIEACACTEGCPGCVTSQTCAHANQVTSKVGALGVLRGLIGLEPLSPDLPLQNERGHASNVLDGQDSVAHTIEEALPVRCEWSASLKMVHYATRN
ncbi:P-loop containing nucleoside triphosphate hydrolase protein, partial [Microstroma glucosiphilum]